MVFHDTVSLDWPFRVTFFNLGQSFLGNYLFILCVLAFFTAAILFIGLLLIFFSIFIYGISYPKFFFNF